MQRKETLFRILVQRKGQIALFCLCTAVLAIAAPFKSYIIQWLIDAGSKAAALRAMGLGILVVLVSHVSEYFSRDLFSRFSTGAIRVARCRVMESVSARTMLGFAQSPTGDVLSAVTNDMKLLYDDYYTGIFNLCMWGGMGLVALIMLAVISPVMMVIAAVLCLLPLLVPRLMAKPLGRVRKTYSEDTARYTGRTGELLRGFETLLTAGGLGYFTRSHEEAARRNEACDAGMRRVMNGASIATSLGAWLPSLSVLLVGVFLVFDGKITIGYLVTVNSLTNFVISPFRMVSGAYVGIKASAPIRRRIEALMNEEHQARGTQAIAHVGEVVFRNVSYAYAGADRPALKNASLTIRPGEKLALAGPSGSGKSTLVRLLYRYDCASGGEITADGLRLERIRLDSWFDRVCMIPQTPFVFTDTLRQNLCLYHEYTQSQLNEAVRRAGLADFVAGLPQGLDTLIEEGGRNLSGGQLQRIAIARALLRGSDLLLVDEATSSLDVATTCAIMDSLLTLDCTVLMITHDLYGEAMSRFDRILYLEDGEIQEEGTLDEMLKREGAFARMYGQMQG